MKCKECDLFDKQFSYCSCYGTKKNPEQESCRQYTKPLWKKQEEDYKRIKQQGAKNA